MYKFVISNSAYDGEIYVNLISSPAGHYLSRRPYVIGLIKELLAAKQMTGPRIIIEHDMGRNIGTTDIVPTSGEDNIYYAQPIKSKVFTRFAKNKYPQQSRNLTVIAVRDADGSYEVTDAWIGSYYPPFPGDENATNDSESYWQTHAFVHDAQLVQSKSITKDCPYETLTVN
jgi:hypothetical protein